MFVIIRKDETPVLKDILDREDLLDAAKGTVILMCESPVFRLRDDGDWIPLEERPYNGNDGVRIQEPGKA